MLALRHRFLLMLSFVAGIGAATALGQPPPAAAQTASTDRELLYITLRNRIGDADPRLFYGDERSELKAGRCQLAETNLRVLSSVAKVSPYFLPDEILRVTAITEMPVQDLLGDPEQDLAPTLYIHGFNMDFEKACRRAAVFQRNAGLEGRLILFSWPSDGVAINYVRDEADLHWSAPDIADMIAELASKFGSGKVNVVGHSLGGRGVMLALYDLASRFPDVRLNNAVFLAPDIDFQLSQKLLPTVRPVVEGKITLYVAESDRPLALSAQLHGYPRLGQTGNDVESLEGVDVIDLSDLPIRTATGHIYHVANPEVGEDLSKVLNDNIPVEGRGLVRSGGNLWRIVSKW